MTLAALTASAVSMPPHARVNSRCYARWNGDRSDLVVVWEGRSYAHPFGGRFDTQPDADPATCAADSCVQRLWCTDTGVVGWYDGQPAGLLEHAWLRDTHTLFVRYLGDHREGGAVVATQGPGAVAVLGATLFYYTHVTGAGRVLGGLPRLTSLVFDAWRADVPGAELVHLGLRGVSVLGYEGGYVWRGAAAIYPSAAGAVTVSVHDATDGWVVDAAVAGRLHRALVHYADAAQPAGATREVATAPGFTCRAQAGGALCHRVAGRATWGTRPVTVLGARYAPLRDAGFGLPSRLWLLAAGPRAPAALAASGLGCAVAFAGDAVVLPELRADAACPSGAAVVLARYRLGRELAPAGATRLVCAAAQRMPRAAPGEASYAAAALKWAGPWAAGAVFAAVDLAAGEYAGVEVVF